MESDAGLWTLRQLIYCADVSFVNGPADRYVPVDWLHELQINNYPVYSNVALEADLMLG